MVLVNVSLSSKEYDRISDIVKKSYPQSCILWIDENKNEILLKEYDKAKEATLAKYGKVNEIECFHGSSYSNIYKIIEDGFNSTYNVRSAYGKGNYFAKHGSYSKDYSVATENDISYMLICNICYGSPCVAISTTKIDTSIYDCYINTLNNPSIYVIPNDSSAYPKYLIAFHKNAV